MRGKAGVVGVLVLAAVMAAGLFWRQGGLGAPRGEQAAAGGPARAATVVAATATTADFPIRRYAIGHISSPAVVQVGARISSQIVAIAVTDGETVAAGDLLFTLDDRALKAQVAHDQAVIARDEATLAGSAADLDRARDLLARQAGTQQAYDQALAAQKEAAATLDADRAQLDADTVQVGFTRITAPISGRLGAINATVGDLTSASGGSAQAPPLATITQMDPLQVGFSLPEGDLPLLQKALASPRGASVTLRRDGERDPIGTGTLTFLDSSVDTASGTIAARATVPNPGLRLWPGQYVSVTLEAGTMPAMVSVPTVAVQPSQKGPFVYVVRPDNTVEARPVTVALTEGDDSALSAGLASGEKVVVEGQTRLRNGAAVREGMPGTAVPGERPARAAREADAGARP